MPYFRDSAGRARKPKTSTSKHLPQSTPSLQESPQADTNTRKQKTSDEMPPSKRAPNDELRSLWGDLVISCRVHPQTLALLPNVNPNEDNEFTTVRYSAVTCKPENFNGRYTLRQMLFAEPWQTVLLIAVQLCDESGKYLARTLDSIFINIEFLCSREGGWRHRGWKKCVLCILVNGRANLSTGAQALLTILGLWQYLGAREVDGYKVSAHVFEHTTCLGVPPRSRRLSVPVQMILCISETHQDPQRSLTWLTESIVPTLNPEMCAFVPVGSSLQPDTVYRLWKRLHLHPKCIAAVGQIEVKASLYMRLASPLAAAHTLQVKLNSILESPFKSALGLATAPLTELSIFRLNPELLTSLKESEAKKSRLNTWTSYFSGHRIWIMRLLSAAQTHGRAEYVHKAKYHVSAAPISAEEYLHQRQEYMRDRAALTMHTWRNAPSVLSSKAGVFRKVKFLFLLSFLTFDLAVSWFAIGNTFLTFFFLHNLFASNVITGRAGLVTQKVVVILYILLLMLSLICALDYHPQCKNKSQAQIRAAITYTWMVVAIYMISIAIATVTVAVSADGETESLAWILPPLTIYGIWLISGILFLNLDPLVVLTSGIQYTLCIFTNTNFINIFAVMRPNSETETEIDTSPLHSCSYSDSEIDDNDPILTSSYSKGRNIPETGSDLDEAYEGHLKVLRKAVSRRALKKRLYKDNEINSQRNARGGMYPVNVVLVWVLSNFVLCGVVLNTILLTRDREWERDRDGMARVSRTVLFIIGCLIAVPQGLRVVGALVYILREIGSNSKYTISPHHIEVDPEEQVMTSILENAAYTIGWICADYVNRVAAQAMLDEEHGRPQTRAPSDNNNNSYLLGKIGHHNVVIACLPDDVKGMTPAAVAALNTPYNYITWGLLFSKQEPAG
ncbi:chitin synthase-domain-containing protein [Aspergillus karnatakaensis]|uniref:chitin synthase-domain-containing protein n=1 Tax=Aspergillus karnatakaensis TaxID=1810916 RepID=UPI003CCCF267